MTGGEPSPCDQVEVRDLCVTLGSFTLGPLSFRLPEGELCCLVGPNGSGKTTLLKTLVGLWAPHRGEVRVAQVTVRGRPPRLLRALGFVPDDPSSMIGELSAQELWELHVLGHARWGADPEDLRRRAARLAAHLDFTPPPRPLSSYSRGMLKKAHLVAGLLHHPRVALLDEPHAGLDPIASARLEGLLDDLRADGVTLLLATHDLRHAERKADRVLLLNEGQLLAEGHPAQVRGTEEDLVAAFLGLVASASSKASGDVAGSGPLVP